MPKQIIGKNLAFLNWEKSSSYFTRHLNKQTNNDLNKQTNVSKLNKQIRSEIASLKIYVQPQAKKQVPCHITSYHSR